MKLYILDLEPRRSARLVMDKHICRALMDAVQLMSIVMVRAGHWAPYHPKDNTWQIDPNEFTRVHQLRQRRRIKDYTNGLLHHLRRVCLYSDRTNARPPPTSIAGERYSMKIEMYISWLEGCGNMDNINWLYSYADELGSEYSRRWGLLKKNPDKIFHKAHQALFEMKNSEYSDFWSCQGSMSGFKDQYRGNLEYNYKDLTTWPISLFSMGEFPDRYTSYTGPGFPYSVYWDNNQARTSVPRKRRTLYDPTYPCRIDKGLHSSYNKIRESLTSGNYRNYREVVSASWNRRKPPPYIERQVWSHSYMYNTGEDLVRALAYNRLRYLCLNGNTRDLESSWSSHLQSSAKDDSIWVKPIIKKEIPTELLRHINDINKLCPWWLARNYGDSRRYFGILNRLRESSNANICSCRNCKERLGLNERRTPNE